MSMVISGSGTITGLSAGGLPSASVTATNLASGAARTNFGAGAVLQVVQGTYTIQQSTTSTSFVASGVAASITPSSASNKVLVEVSMNGVTTTGGCFYTIYRDSTNLGSGSNSCFAVVSASSGDTPLSMRFLDSPSTTSSVTYTVYYKVNSGTGYTTPQGMSVINLSEIAA